MTGRVALKFAPVALIFGLLVLLEVCVRSGVVSRHVVPAPTRILLRLGEMVADGSLWPPLIQSGRVFLIALAGSVLIGFALGLILHALPRLRRAVAPVLTSYFAVPIFVFYPLFIVLFGLGDLALGLIAGIFGMMAFISATLNGLDRLPRVFGRTAQVMGLSPGARLWYVTLPSLAPHLMVGGKIAVTYALIGVIGGEFILATEGLGYRIAFAYNNFETERMYALMTVIILIAVGLNGALQQAEVSMRRKFK